MKRTNMAIVAVVAVVIIVCAAFAYASQDDAPSDDGSRFQYELVPITDEMKEWTPPDEARASWEETLSSFLDASATEGSDIAAALDEMNGPTCPCTWTTS